MEKMDSSKHMIVLIFWNIFKEILYLGIATLYKSG
jgi:hypothetical protein